MVSQHQIAVVTDSSASLPAYLAQRWNIGIVPHTLIVDNQPFRDQIDIQSAEFYRLLRKGGRQVSTAAPEPSAFLKAFADAYETAPEVLCIVIASRYSATYSIAQAAKQSAREALPGLQIHILDSLTAAGALGLLVLETARAASSGLAPASVLQLAERTIPSLHLLATLSDLGYLRASGRVSRVVSSAASVLHINPVFELRQGMPCLLARPHSRRRAIAQMLTYARQIGDGNPLHVNIMEADEAVAAEALRKAIEAELDCRELFVSEMTPVIGAHTGPGLLGIAFRISGDAGYEALPF